MRRFYVSMTLVMAVLSACGDDSGLAATSLGDSSGGSKTAGIDVCTLLTDDELSAVLGVVPAAEATEGAGPFTGCSWGIGDVLVQVATSDSLILAPGQAEDCPSANIGEVSVSCPGSVKFLLNGIHTSVTTIGATTEDQLLALARTIPSKLPS